MKLNATAEMLPVTWPQWGRMHPFVPMSQAAGYQEIFKQLEAMHANGKLAGLCGGEKGCCAGKTAKGACCAGKAGAHHDEKKADANATPTIQ